MATRRNPGAPPHLGERPYRNKTAMRVAEQAAEAAEQRKTGDSVAPVTPSTTTPIPAPRSFRHDRPGPARHIARAVILNAMDYEEAVRVLMRGAGLTDAEVVELADRWEKSPLVQKFVQDGLRAQGLDENSKEAFVKLMWEWLYTGSKDDRNTAARILGKGFIGEKVTVEKPQPLPIEGLAEITKSMLRENEDEGAGEGKESPVVMPGTETVQ